MVVFTKNQNIRRGWPGLLKYRYSMFKKKKLLKHLECSKMQEILITKSHIEHTHTHTLVTEIDVSKANRDLAGQVG